MALACYDANFIPPSTVRMMAEELSFLPSWWAADGDAIWVSCIDTANEWHRRYTDLLPSINYVNRLENCCPDGVHPWGWSPMMVRRLVKSGISNDLLPDNLTLDKYRVISSRRSAYEMLHEIFHPHSTLWNEWKGYLCGEMTCCLTEEQVMQRVNGAGRTILKAPWSGSGKGLRFGDGCYLPPLSGWCARVLREQGSLFVEPLYNRVYDFALEFYSDGLGKVSYEGLSVFYTTQRGTYDGNRVAPEEENVKWLTEYIPRQLFEDLVAFYERKLGDLYGADYKGFLGIDMMLCRESDSAECCLHPCVEINFRYTMGLVAVRLSRFLQEGSEGVFKIEYFKDSNHLKAYYEEKMKEKTMVVEGGKMVKGFLSLTPITSNTHYIASLEVF